MRVEGDTELPKKYSRPSRTGTNICRKKVGRKVGGKSWLDGQ